MKKNIFIKKIIYYSIPVLTLILFIIIMTSGILLKNSMKSSQEINEYLSKIKTNIVDEEWDQAHKNFVKLKNMWDIVKKWIQFSVERDEFIRFDLALARLEGTIMARDKVSALIAINETTEIWTLIGK